MANTTFSPKIFSNELVTKFDQVNVFQSYANNAFTGKLAAFGDSVHVQTAPTITFTAATITGAGATTFVTGTGPGGVISATDFTIVGENIVINKYYEYRSIITQLQITQSQVDLEEMLADRYAHATADLMDSQFRDQILVTDVATIPAANKLYSGAPKADVSKTTIYGYIEEMRVALANQNCKTNLVLFVSPVNFSRLLQSGVMDNSDKGLDVRTSGRIGMLGNVKIVETVSLTASSEMIMLQDQTVNFITQFEDASLKEGPDGNYFNFIAASYWGGKILAEMAKGICIFYASA